MSVAPTHYAGLPAHVAERKHVIVFSRTCDGYRYATQTDLHKAREAIRTARPARSGDAVFVTNVASELTDVAARSFERGTDVYYIDAIEGTCFDPPLCLSRRSSRVLCLTEANAAPFLDGDMAAGLCPDAGLEAYNGLPLFEAARKRIQQSHGGKQ